MQITNIKFSEPKIEGAVKQFVTICLDDLLIIRGLRIVETKSGGMFVSFPNRKLENGHRVYSSNPVNEDFRKYIEEEVFKCYAELNKDI